MPQGDTIRAMHGTATDDVWAVGDHGLVMHYDGSQWSYDRVGVEDLRGVYAAARDDVWTVGWYGSAAHYDGSVWTSMPMPDHPTIGAPSFNALWGAAADDLWAVGYSALVGRFDGSAWTVSQQGPVGADYYSVWGAASDDVWLSAENRTVYYDGNTFSQPGAPMSGQAEPFVFGTATDDVWLGDYDDHLDHYDGNVWTSVPRSPPTFYGMTAGWSPARNEAWVAGYDGVLLHGTPTGVTDVRWEGDALYAFWGTATDAWAGGIGGRLVHFDGVSWTPTLPPAAWRLMGISGTGPDDVWAVGARGITLHRDADGWKLVELDGAPQAVLYGVLALAPDDVWAVGSRQVRHWDGAGWTQSLGGDVRFEVISGTAPDDVWIVGQNNTTTNFERYHYDGVAWSAPEVLPAFCLALHGFARDDGWAVVGTKLQHFDGAQWTNIADVPAGQGIVSIGGTSSTDLWLVAPQAVFHWDGASLTTVETAMFAGLSLLDHVIAFAADDVWFVDHLRHLFHFNGTTIEKFRSPTSSPLNGAWSDGTNFWIIGDGATVMRLSARD
jgi:hypothetical protein